MRGEEKHKLLLVLACLGHGKKKERKEKLLVKTDLGEDELRSNT